jgi:hypothetical protein
VAGARVGCHGVVGWTAGGGADDHPAAEDSVRSRCLRTGRPDAPTRTPPDPADLELPRLICTEGVPSAAVHALLASAPQAVVRWRNDFDWTGVRLTAAAVTRYPNAVPWRMAAADYEPVSGTGPALIGAPADTRWDPPLRAAMLRAGRAVKEERLLGGLLADLRHASGPSGSGDGSS